MDLDGDGRSDIISGSWPGEIYWYRRQRDGGFAAAELLEGGDGKPLDVGSASAAHAADWDADGTVDLLIGTLTGEVYFVPGQQNVEEPIFGPPQELVAAGEPIRHGDSAPVAADWDGDGRLDLVLGTGEGSVLWYRNAGTPENPELAKPEVLVPESPVGWGGDDERDPGEWGMRTKPCVTDFNGDGRLDLLVGDRCGSFLDKPSRSARESAREESAVNKLPELRRKWASAFREYRRLLAADSSEQEEVRQDKRKTLRKTMQRYKREIAAVQQVLEYYRPQQQAHGFVWLFLRKPAGPSR